jgi:hypothetical protein
MVRLSETSPIRSQGEVNDTCRLECEPISIPSCATWRIWSTVISGLRGPAASHLFDPPSRSAITNTVAVKPKRANAGTTYSMKSA